MRLGLLLVKTFTAAVYRRGDAGSYSILKRDIFWKVIIADLRVYFILFILTQAEPCFEKIISHSGRRCRRFASSAWHSGCGPRGASTAAGCRCGIQNPSGNRWWWCGCLLRLLFLAWCRRHPCMGGTGLGYGAFRRYGFLMI